MIFICSVKYSILH